MGILGISDPYILAGYAGCILTVVLCIYWGLFRSAGEGEDE
jgi:hypothetical protein